MIHCKPVECWQFLECQAPCTNLKPLSWRLSDDDSVWTVHWNIHQSIQSSIKQSVSLLGFNTAQSWKSSLWPGCVRWNGQRSAAKLIVTSTILSQHGLCLTSETMRLLKCSEISKINSFTATELVWRRSPCRTLWSMRHTKVCKELFFDSLSLHSKPSKSH